MNRRSQSQQQLRPAGDRAIQAGDGDAFLFWLGFPRGRSGRAGRRRADTTIWAQGETTHHITGKKDAGRVETWLGQEDEVVGRSLGIALDRAREQGNERTSRTPRATSAAQRLVLDGIAVCQQARHAAGFCFRKRTEKRRYGL